jgi:hypothetical protein
MTANPPPQRALRGHLPARPTPRDATGGEHLARLAARLTPRDRWLARMLAEHRVLTTHQIHALAFATSPRTATGRLRRLYTWRVLDRFQPFVTTGSAPMHHVLDVAGNAVLAAEDGLDPDATGYRHDRAIGISHSLRLAHTVGVNTFFTALVHHARRPEAPAALTAWWSEGRCRRRFGDLTRPDAYGRWRDHTTGAEVEWFLEYDCGTEPLGRLAAKLPGYHALAAATGAATPVLVWLPGARREAGARHALAAAVRGLDRPQSVPVATTAADLADPAHRADPAVARWLPLPTAAAAAPGRLRLAELARAWPGLPPPAARTAPPPGPGEPAPPPPMPPGAPRPRAGR